MKLAIFDKDNTLTETISGEQFVQHPRDQRLRPGVAQALKTMHQNGWDFAIATNQGGVASGYKSLGSAIDELRYAMGLTDIRDGMLAPAYDNGADEGVAVYVNIQGVETHIKSEKLRFRKPAGGMLLWLKDKYKSHNIGKDQVLIGDHDDDRKAAINGFTKFVHVDDWLKNPLGI